MKPKIIKSDSSAEYYTGERCFISELSNSTDDPEMSIARARVEPGVSTQWHSLAETTERYVITQGVGEVFIGDMQRRQVIAGDVVLIPPGCQQRITTTGEEDLVFLASCTPRCSPENYVSRPS